jgi:hypothetical protein
LARGILIHVAALSCDPHAWDMLQHEVIARLVQEALDDVPGVTLTGLTDPQTGLRERPPYAGC